MCGSNPVCTPLVTPAKCFSFGNRAPFTDGTHPVPRRDATMGKRRARTALCTCLIAVGSSRAYAFAPSVLHVRYVHECLEKGVCHQDVFLACRSCMQVMKAPGPPRAKTNDCRWVNLDVGAFLRMAPSESIAVLCRYRCILTAAVRKMMSVYLKHTAVLATQQ